MPFLATIPFTKQILKSIGVIIFKFENPYWVAEIDLLYARKKYMLCIQKFGPVKMLINFQIKISMLKKIKLKLKFLTETKKKNVFQYLDCSSLRPYL